MVRNSKTAASLPAYLRGAALGVLGGAYLDDKHKARGAALGALAGLGTVGLGSAALRALEGRVAPAALEHAAVSAPNTLESIATPVAAITPAEIPPHYRGRIGEAIKADPEKYLGYTPHPEAPWTPDLGTFPLVDFHSEFTPEEIHEWASQIPGVVRGGHRYSSYDVSTMKNLGERPVGQAWVTEALAPSYGIPKSPPLVYGKVRVSDSVPLGEDVHSWFHVKRPELERAELEALNKIQATRSNKTGSLTLAKTAGINAALAHLGLI